MKTMNPLHQLILEATGVAVTDVARIENIMRDEIFHSTLDWQTREQLMDGAQQAQERLEANQELYDLEHQSWVEMFNKMQSATNSARGHSQ
jgi:hypothetical protein